MTKGKEHKFIRKYKNNNSSTILTMKEQGCTWLDQVGPEVEGPTGVGWGVEIGHL